MARSPVVEERRPETAEESEAPTCRHHWIIETPRGALSNGRCKACGEERQFRNSATDHLWEDESGGGYNAWRGSRSSVRKTSAAGDDDEVAAASHGSLAAVMV